MNDEQLLRYSRHIALPELGIEAQEQFSKANAVIVGVGGLGSQVAQFLAGAGVGTLTLIDSDTVDITNLQRQTLYTTADIGLKKVESACLHLLTQNPEIMIRTHDDRADFQKLVDIFSGASIVIDCTDNFKTRHAINRAAVAAKIPHVSGAAIRFDGQITLFDHRDSNAPCYHCIFGEEESLEEARCATLGVFAPLVGIVGSIQAAEALKVLAQTGKTLSGQMLMINAMTMEAHAVKLHKNPLCAVCGI
ncbi:MAG: HesA/MoeB/ThiF family protein [Burkholderiales bacterium]|jgi:molybdopterin/thiamine biosynthesis adenylyltransferase|nr:HesA/MoeB/ThiF family protein [Burkholderiales bacterium]